MWQFGSIYLQQQYFPINSYNHSTIIFHAIISNTILHIIIIQVNENHIALWISCPIFMIGFNMELLHWAHIVIIFIDFCIISERCPQHLSAMAQVHHCKPADFPVCEGRFSWSAIVGDYTLRSAFLAYANFVDKSVWPSSVSTLTGRELWPELSTQCTTMPMWKANGPRNMTW